MQVENYSPLRMLHKEPMGATMTAIVLAIYFGLLSIQRIPNTCWQAVWCGVIFNWEAGSPSSSQGLECVCVHGGWMGHRWRLASIWVPLWLCGCRAAGDHASGSCPYNYRNLWHLFTAANTWLCLLVFLQPCTAVGQRMRDRLMVFTLM